VYDFIINK